jgi:glycosyltransferase involved in cell wall biosynthesis
MSGMIGSRASSEGNSLPRVSFILPVRNSEQTLNTALHSLAHQSFSDFDVLIFDDGSKDHTLEIAERYAKQDARFRVVGSDRVGIVEALNRAAEQTDAPFLARMDGDDISHPERLADTLALLDTHPELELAGVLVAGFPETALGPGMARYIDWLNKRVTPEDIARDIFIESPLCHPSVIMRRRAFEAAGGYQDNGGPEDYGLWLRFHCRGFQMAKVPKIRLLWRDSLRRLSRTDDRYARHRFVDLKVEALERMYLSRNGPVTIWGTGKIGRMFSRALARRGYAPVAFIDIDKKRIGRTVHGAPVLDVPRRSSEIPGGLLLAAVGTAGARERIRAHLTGLGLMEHCHFVSIA